MYLRTLFACLFLTQIVSCKTTLRNNLDELSLACGVEASRYSAQNLFRLDDEISKFEKSDIRLYIDDENGDPALVDFVLTKSNCIKIKSESDQELEKPVSILFKNRLAGKISLKERHSTIPVVKLESCGPFCGSYPNCGFLNGAKETLKTSQVVFKVPLPEGRKINALLELGDRQEAIEINGNNCFVLEKNTGGMIKITDNSGNFFEKKSSDLFQFLQGKSVEKIELRMPLNFDEKKCKNDPNSYRLNNGKCVAKTFEDFCKESGSNAGVALLNTFYVIPDCDRIWLSLREKKILEFTTKGLNNVEIFSGMENLSELNLSSNPFTSLVSLIDLPNLEVLRLNYLKLPFDLSSINHFTSLKTLAVSGTKFKSMQKFDVKSGVVELEASQTDREFLSRFPNLRKLTITSDKNLDLSSIAKLSNLEYLEIQSVISISNLSELGKLEKLKVLVLNGSEISKNEHIPNINSLEKLIFSGTNLPDLGMLARMKKLRDIELDVLASDSSFQLPSDISATSLALALNDVSKLILIESFPHLENLKLTGNLDNLSLMPAMSHIKALDAKFLILLDLTGIEKFRSLEKLELSDGSPSLDLSLIPYLESLRVFAYTEGDDSLNKDLSWLSKMPNLTHLDLNMGNMKLNLPGVFPTSLYELELESKEIISFDFLKDLKNLHTLTLHVSDSVNDLEEHDFILPQIKKVALDITPQQYVKMPLFPGVIDAELNLHEGARVSLGAPDISIKRSLFPNVQDLGFREFSGFEILKNFPSTVNLTITTDKSDFKTVPSLASVQTLNIYGSSLENLDGIENFSGLEELSLWYSSKIKSLDPLKNLKFLNNISDKRKLRGNFLGDEMCPVSSILPSGLRNYCLDPQMDFSTSFGPSPF